MATALTAAPSDRADAENRPVIRTVIVDDERLARDGIREMLAGETDINIVAEAADGSHAVKTIQKLKPELVFLDIQLPGFDGIEVVRRIMDDHLPSVVFVTAYDKHAVEAFELEAVDYVLKPVTPSRLQEALRRVRRDMCDERRLIQRHESVIDTVTRHDDRDGPSTKPTKYVTRFAVRARDRYVVVNVARVSWIESAGNYVQIHADGKSFLMRTTMAEVEQRLDPETFLRVHRTAIANLNCVQEVVITEHGDHSIHLDDGTFVRLSRGCRDRVFDALYRGQHAEE